VVDGQGRSSLAEGYWAWLKAKQADYVIGYAPLWVSVTLFLALACVTGPLGLVIGLLAGYGTQGFETGVAVALPLSIPVAAYAKHLGRRGRGEDKWQPR
jgi:hypothetical protein